MGSYFFGFILPIDFFSEYIKLNNPDSFKFMIDSSDDEDFIPKKQSYRKVAKL